MIKWQVSKISANNTHLHNLAAERAKHQNFEQDASLNRQIPEAAGSEVKQNLISAVKFSQRPTKAQVKGFTLIEMMFLVLILGIVALHIAQVQQQKNEQIILERASQDILAWQTVAVNYWAANQRWPSNFSDLASQLPPNAICSPFPTSTSNTNCGNYNQYSGSISGSSYVIKIDTGNQQLANALINKLLNSWPTGTDNTTVNALIPAPTQTAAAQYRGYLVSAGYTTLNNSTQSNKSILYAHGAAINLPNCPAGFEGHILLSPIDYQSDDSWGIHLTMVTPSGLVYTQPLSNDPFVYQTTQRDIHHKRIYVVAAMDHPTTDMQPTDEPQRDLRHLAQYLTFCLPQLSYNNSYRPNSVYTATYSSAWNTNYIEQIYGNGMESNNEGLGDGQCSTSWQEYYKIEGRTTNLGCQWTAAHKKDGNIEDASTFKAVPVGLAPAY